MENKLSDYLHLYLVCEVEYKEEVWKLKSVEIGINGNVCGKITRKRPNRQTWDLENYEFRNGSTPIKPILRPLSSMTIEDVKEWSDNLHVTVTPYCVELDSKDHGGEFTQVYPDGSILSKSKDDGDIRPINGGELFRLLLSKHFDLFNLIPEGLAIDATQQPLPQ